VAILACYGAGLLGSIFVSADTAAWYQSLQKPFFTPPNWLFAPVWLVLFGLMAASLTIIWNKDPNAQDARGWVPLFFTHLLLNAAWTMFFFGLHALLISLIEIALLLAAIVILMCGAFEIDKRAGYLLIPYLLWVSFAALLNGALWYLN
jgi:tryptophan-rich sensory protein